MKNIILAVLMLSAFAVAGTKRNPADYAVTVHVVQSRMIVRGTYYQRLSAIIDGKKYELQSEAYAYGFLVPGDYKARLLNDGHKSQYDSWQVYEFLFPDNKTRRYLVLEVGP